jgi:hypothetical protein
LKDYYAILGLGPDADVDSIKRAYRQKAREAHPDRFSHAGDDAEAEATAMMSELNEAYGVLSDEEQRREYDVSWRAMQAGQALPEPPRPAPPSEVIPVTPAPRREKARPTSEVGTSVIREFAARLRKELLENKKFFQWKEKKLDGFDWALEVGFFMESYCVASRTLALVDPETARSFCDTAGRAVQKSSHTFKNDYFLFLLAFQALDEPEQVQALLRRFRPSGREVKLQIALVDVTHGRSLLCGPRIRNERFQELLKLLHLGR